METRDYLMRQFNQLGKVLGKLLADLFDSGNNVNAHQALENINQELITALDLDIETIISIPPGELISWFSEKYEADFTNFEDLAEFLFQVGHLYHAQDEAPKANAIFEQALAIYKYLLENENTFSFEIHLRISEISKFLNKAL